MFRPERQILLSRAADRLGVNRVVLALSIARLADAVGNSILFIIIPLYVAQLPSPWFSWPETVVRQEKQAWEVIEQEPSLAT